MRRNDELYLEFDSISKETEKAYRVSKDGHEVWFPKSQVKRSRPPHRCENQMNWLCVTQWIVDQKTAQIPKEWKFYTGWELVGDYPDDDMDMAWWEMQ
jgi:hypothetical protein